jgi:hypothetical protein
VATLSILNSFELDSNGRLKSGKQGEADSAVGTAFELTVSGTCHFLEGTLATATVITLWDDDNDFPADFDYLYFWADQDCYLQFVGTATNFTLKVEAYCPFVLPGFDELLAAASTTLITGGTEPTMESIDSVALGNYSGNTLNYTFSVID